VFWRVDEDLVIAAICDGTAEPIVPPEQVEDWLAEHGDLDAIQRRAQRRKDANEAARERLLVRAG